MAYKARKRRPPPDHYGALGVARKAAFREIEAAYWEQVKRTENRDKIALLNEAYEVLGDTNRRAAHDETLVAFGPVAKEPAGITSPAHANPDLANRLRWHLQ
jgi:curved DNA-binding protein CbpA